METKIEKKQGYKSLLNEAYTEEAVQLIKETFSKSLAQKLNLQKVTAPIMLWKGTGVNDDLNGVEKPVNFFIRGIDDKQAEVIQSLAKWKRQKLASLGYEAGKGIYTDMYALRPDEELSSIHSAFVDQWDWEKVMSVSERNVEFLKATVRTIFSSIKETEKKLLSEFGQMEEVLPEEIWFIHSEELQERFPHLSTRQREDEICREKKAVFIIGIGGELDDGKPHDLRAPDYDDWSTETTKGMCGLNGDILIWNPVLGRAFEISSMGIRVDRAVLLKQLEELELTGRLKLDWHRSLMKGELPQTIGGGIGQSRLCMLLMRKAHIGEVQPALWPDAMISKCKSENILLL